jgi:hypothetical protein
MRVERLVHAELAVHVVEVVPADASETVGDGFEADPFGRPISFERVRRTNDLRQFGERSIFVQVVAPDDCGEGTEFAVVPEFGIGHVNTVPSVTADQFVSCGRKMNSGSGSMNFVINHGHAIRSTFAFSRVTHFMRLPLNLNDTTAILTLATESSECQD